MRSVKLSPGVKQLGMELLEPKTPSGEAIRDRLLAEARITLIDELDLRKQDEHYANALLAQGCKEIEVGWRDGKVQAYLSWAAGAASPLVPDSYGDAGEVAGKIAEALEKVGVDLVDPELYVVMEDEVIAREEAGVRLVKRISEARDLLFLLGSLDSEQVAAMKGALTRLIGSLKSTGNTGELLALLLQLASHDSQ